MFFNTNECFIVYRICKLRKRQPGAGYEETGPYDTSSIVWALGELFFFVFMLFDTNLCLKMSGLRRDGRARAEGMDNGWGSRRVVSRAPGMFLLFLFTISYLLTFY